MKGRTPSAIEKRFHDNLCRMVGCIACRHYDNFNDYVSVHHMDGRTKPMAHKLVLPLCAGHHQKGTGNDRTMLAFHGDKVAFEAKYGTQRELLAKCVDMLTEQGASVPQELIEWLA